MKYSENESKTIFIQRPLRSQYVDDLSSETADLVKSWRLLGAILGPLRGLLCPSGGLLEPSWTVVRPSESEFKAIFIWSPLPKSVCGRCIKRNGRSGRVLEASWRHLRPLLEPFGPFQGPLGAIMDRQETFRKRIQNDIDSEWRMPQAKRSFWWSIGGFLAPS